MNDNFHISNCSRRAIARLYPKVVAFFFLIHEIMSGLSCSPLAPLSLFPPFKGGLGGMERGWG